MRIEFHKLTKEIISIIEDSNSITAYPSEHGVLEGDNDTVLEMAVLLGLDISQIPNNMTPERIRVYKDIAFGKRLFIRFLEENKAVDITTEENVSLLEVFAPLKQLLESGAIETARDLLLTSPATNFVLTPSYETVEARKQSYLNEIESYLNPVLE